MHEWAVAEAIVLAVIKEAKKNGLKSLNQIVLKIGELQRMDKDVLCIAMESLFKEYGYELSLSNFFIQDEPASFKCNFCGSEWPYSQVFDLISEDEREYIHFLPEIAHGFIKCPSCGSFDYELEKGRGVIIESIVGERC